LRLTGFGTEKVVEAVKAAVPKARVERVDRDLAQRRGAVGRVLAAFEAGESDVLVGTQMIAKGHDFPRVTLVGVIDADVGLGLPDFRAAERTFQLLTQVAGRAGRAARPGRVLLQTFQPENPVMRALVSGDTQAFLKAEAADREAALMPPFGRLAALIVSGPAAAAAAAFATELGRRAPHGPDVAVYGPAPPPLAMLRGQHRQRLLLKTGRDIDIQAVLRRWLGSVKLPKSLRLAVDVDPYSFL
jgi:primosomal protein N' (replication factor Y)